VEACRAAIADGAMLRGGELPVMVAGTSGRCAACGRVLQDEGGARPGGAGSAGGCGREAARVAGGGGRVPIRERNLTDEARAAEADGGAGRAGVGSRGDRAGAGDAEGALADGSKVDTAAVAEALARGREADA